MESATILNEYGSRCGTREAEQTFKLQMGGLKTAFFQSNWLGPVITEARVELHSLRKQEWPNAGGPIVVMNQDRVRTDRQITGALPHVAVSNDPSASKMIVTFTCTSPSNSLSW